MPKPRFLQHSPDDPEVLPTMEDLQNMSQEELQSLTPEQQQEIYQRALENERRKIQERDQDIAYDTRQKRKLKRELNKGQSKERTTGPKDMSQVEKERAMTEEYLRKQKQTETVDEELEKLMSDPSIMVQEPEGGRVCMNNIEGEPCGEPAAFTLMMGGLLGPDMPNIELCDTCARLVKMVPRGAKQEPGPDTTPLSLKKKKTKKSTISRVPNMLVALATKLDSKGMYAEADLIDKILNSVEV